MTTGIKTLIRTSTRNILGLALVNGPLVADGEIDATKPEALIYEFSHGRARLVGVEFIVDAATWLANHGSAPVLEGQSFQLVDSPNRYGIPAPFFDRTHGLQPWCFLAYLRRGLSGAPRITRPA